VIVRVRLGAGLSRHAAAPVLGCELPDGATVETLLEHLRATQPELAPALRSALPVVAGAHADRARRLAHGDQVALLIPVSGG
jgi:molybdopterin converting factor small subunit